MHRLVLKLPHGTQLIFTVDGNLSAMQTTLRLGLGMSMAWIKLDILKRFYAQEEELGTGYYK